MKTVADCEIKIGGVAVALCAERAAFVPAEGLLLAADLHLGKSQTFRAGGAMIPRGVTDEQFRRLDSAIGRLRPSRVVFLGDLFHAPIGVTEDIASRLGNWVERCGARVALVHGNHDRRLGKGLATRLGELGIEDLGAEATVGGLTLVHDVCDTASRPAVGGHHHPAIRIERDMGEGGTKIPAFHLRDDGGLTLPAFSRFTGGVAMRRRAGERLFAVAEERVIPL